MSASNEQSQRERPSPSEEARQIIADYIDDLREIIKKLRRKLN